MPSRRTLAETIGYLAELCGELGLRWAVVGALAANLYRDRPRLTQDVDVTLEVGREHWPAFSGRLRADGWSVQPELSPYPDVALLRSERYLPVDVLLAKTDYQRTALGRARTHALAREELVVPVLAPEDVIVHKLISARAVDMDDVERILVARPSLDLQYLERWIAEWGLEERWQRVRGG